jgi:hypothetical protein
VPREELAEIFAALTSQEVLSEQTLDGFRDFLRHAAVANRPRNRLTQSNGHAGAV